MFLLGYLYYAINFIEFYTNRYRDNKEEFFMNKFVQLRLSITKFI